MDQNATPSEEAAMTPTEESDRNFGIPDTDVEQWNMNDNVPQKAKEEAPEAGHPNQEAKQERLYGGKYKTVEEFEKAHKEAETRFHEMATEKKRFEDTLKQTRDQLSYAEQQRLRYEQMLSQHSVPDQKSNVVDDFRKNVNDDDRVIDSVTNLTKHVASELVDGKINPQLKEIQTELQKVKTRNFNDGLGEMKKNRPDFDKLLPEIGEYARQELGDIYSRMVEKGIAEPQARAFVDDLNLDLTYVDSVYKKVRGSKGKEYWAGEFQTSSSKEIETAKSDLAGGGGGSGEADSVSSEEFKRLLATPGASNDPKLRAMVGLRPKGPRGDRM